MRVFLVVLLIVALASAVQAKDLHLSWDAVTNATGYRVQISTTQGQSWGEIRDGNATKTDFWWLGALDTGLTLFRVGAKGPGIETWNTVAGAWYNGSWDLASPKGAGIK
jgi:hypothetical protein